MEIITLREEYIKLGQALKAAGLVDSGVEAKYAVEEGKVKVNGTTACREGKTFAEDMVEFRGQTIKIEARKAD